MLEMGADLRLLIPGFRTARLKAGLDSPERSQAPPWKFWRKLSTRRTDKKSRAGTKSPNTNTAGRLCDWTHPGPYPGGGTLGDGGVLVTSGSLPDVVDKAVFRRSNSLKAPPKPPRLFLFRSSSINNPRSSLDGGSARNSLVGAGGGGYGLDCGGLDVLVDAEPIYVNAAFGAGLQTGLSGNDRIIPPTVHNNNNNNNNNNSKDVSVHGQTNASDMESETKQTVTYKGRAVGHNGTLPHSTKTSSSAKTTSNYNTLPASGKSSRTSNHNNNNQRLKPGADGAAKKGSGRSRCKSSERSELCRHKHIMHSVLELLCQRLDPFPLLDELLAAGVLTDMDVQAFRGHPDRKLICESLASIVGDGDYTHFLSFIEVLRAGDEHQEIVRLLEAMRDMDKLIHDLPCRADSKQVEDDPHMLADEKMISYEIGYLSPDGVTLKPVVELERVRPVDRRSSKRISRLSAFTTSVTDSIDGGEVSRNGDATSSSQVSVPSITGPVMMNACVTGYNLSGERAQALADVIQRHDCILELRIGKTQLCSSDVSAVCRAVAQNATLASLDIRLNALDLAGASAVADMLVQTQALRQLNLSSTGLDVAGCGAVFGALVANRTLTELDMSFLDVGDAVCESVRDMLKANSCLQKLRLRSNNFSAAGCFALAEGLNRNRSLLELDLSRNCISDEGLEALSRYVPESALTELSLENCGLTSAGCDALAQMVSGSKRLRTLDLSVNFLGDQGVFRLAAALERSSVLQTVGLNMCGVTNDGFSKLLDVLEKNASISLLKLCYNRLGKEYQNPAATSDNLRYRLRIVTSSKPKLKILLWGNAFDEA
nr:hypothetical protein BaRGS_028108 [Batillaria attramentaria]